MRAELHIAQSLLLSPWPWIAAATAFAATAWLGQGSTEGWLLAGSVGALVLVTVGWRTVASRRLRVVSGEVRDARAEAVRAEVILNSLPAMVWRCGDSSDRTFISPVWLAVTGQVVSEALEMGWLNAVHPEDRSRCQSAHRLAAVNHEPFEVEYRLRRADGEHRWVCDRAAPCFDERGAFCGYAGLTIDIQHRVGDGKALAEQIERHLQLNETINARAMELTDRYEDLEDAKQQAEYTDQLKCDFLSALSDEMRGPVLELDNASGLLDTPDLPESLHEPFLRIRGAATALSKLLRRTASLGGIEEEAEPVEPGRFDLRRLVLQVLKRQAEAAEGRGLAVEYVLDEDTPIRVEADPLRLRRILTEIWTVMVRNGKNGRLKFRMMHDAAQGRDVTVRFTLSLVGDGITDELLERAFYPSEAVLGEPVGLGLGTPRRLARRMGGDVGVQRDSSGVTMVWLAIPVIDVNPNQSGRRAQRRLPQEGLSSDLGPVLDLSLGGMRVQAPKLPEGQFDIKLSDDEETVHVRAEVAWSRRVAFGKHEAGLRFVEMDAELRAGLSRIATRNRMRRVLASS